MTETTTEAPVVKPDTREHQNERLLAILFTLDWAAKLNPTQRLELGKQLLAAIEANDLTVERMRTATTYITGP